MLLLLSVGGLVLAVSGCATILSAPEEHSPRALASLQLTEQGRILLESGDPDNAISIFERAININPTNGQNYYYLSEAWLLKGNTIQAKEFNRLAEIHLEDDRGWMRRVFQQRERIEERSG
ncbi:MAG: tetratricopeptide repeat protein [Desulfobacterales bacterium]|nr:tetratricopeptide repeat protein [Desulfobacterales bacterium]